MLLSDAGDLGGLCLLAALCILGIAVLALRTDARQFRRRLAAEEAARRQWLRNLADASFDGLLIHRQGLILQMNRALARMLGAREREWLGQHFANLARPDQVAALRAELEAPQPQTMEFTLLRPNKSEVAVEISSNNIDFEGQPATVTAIRDISQRLADAARISRLTHYDPLTGLANRKLFADLLASALSRHERVSGTITVFTFDIDRFKTVNDRIGRASGDLLLKQVAARIAAMTAKEDLLARLGGDKFALLMTSPAGPCRALSLGGELAAAFNEPFIIDGQLIKISLSVGIAVYPDHAGDADALMAASAFALAQAERAGGGGAHMFCHNEAGRARRAALSQSTPDAPADARADLQRLGADLRHAVARGEMHPLYQPIYRAADLAPAGFEALPRWQHKTRGLLTPERFIPVADAAGLTHEIFCHLLEQACTEANTFSLTRIALTLAAAQLRDINFPTCITAALRKTGLKPELLELGVTETLLTEQHAGLPRAIRSLAATGVSLALVEFGTGQAPLTALCDLPFSRLKIDRRFVQKLGRDPNVDAILGALLGLAANLRLEVTATGVETMAQLDLLRRHGCHCVQGGLLGPATTRAARRPAAIAAPSLPALVAS